MQAQRAFPARIAFYQGTAPTALTTLNLAESASATMALAAVQDAHAPGVQTSG